MKISSIIETASKEKMSLSSFVRSAGLTTIQKTVLEARRKRGYEIFEKCKYMGKILPCAILYGKAGKKDHKMVINEQGYDVYVPEHDLVIMKSSSMIKAEAYREMLKQLGGTNRLIAMIGASNFIHSNNGNSLQFKFKNQRGPNFFKMTLNNKDLYDLEFGKLSGVNYKVVKTFDNVYVDKVHELFEKTTGLYLRL